MNRSASRHAMILGGVIFLLIVCPFVFPGLLRFGPFQGVYATTVNGPQTVLKKGDNFPADVMFEWLEQSDPNATEPITTDVTQMVEKGSYFIVFHTNTSGMNDVVFESLIRGQKSDPLPYECGGKREKSHAKFILVAGSRTGLGSLWKPKDQPWLDTVSQTKRFLTNIPLLIGVCTKLSLYDPGQTFSKEYGWTSGDDLLNYYVMVIDGKILSIGRFDMFRNLKQNTADFVSWWLQYQVTLEGEDDMKPTNKLGLLTFCYYHGLPVMFSQPASTDKTEL